MGIDEDLFEAYFGKSKKQSENQEQEIPKKDSLLDKIFDSKIFNSSAEIPSIAIGLVLLFYCVLPLGITNVKKINFSEGQKSGIELMQTIYNIQGGNEPLRYTSYNK
jgi:hypothetical protein